MTIYEQKLNSLRSTVYANTWQINTVIQVRKYIENHYDIDINLDVLSSNQLVSKYHLLRLFKKYYGQTPRQYLMDKRIEKSKEKLIHGMSVTQTCFAVGFESLGSFSALFKAKRENHPVNFKKSNFREANLCKISQL